MSDTQEGVAGAPVEQSPGFIGGFAPATPQVPDPVVPVVTATPVTTTPPPAPVDTPPVERTALADLIRSQREARQAAQVRAKGEADATSRLTEAQAEIERLKKADRFEDDPVGYVKARKLPKEQQLLLGQALLYDLAPDKAPGDIRQRLFEQRLAREKAEEAGLVDRQRQEEAQRSQLTTIQSFADTLSESARTFTPGSYPESEVWFTGPDGSTDHDTYARSLLATASNMAAAAQRNHQVADLHPANVAKVLEAEVARRMATRDAKRGAVPTKPAESTKKVEGDKQVTETSSTKGLNVIGAKTPRSWDDTERVRRATEAAFRAR